MSTDAPGGGSSSPVELEFENIKTAVSKMTGIATDIGKLKSDFTGFAHDVKADDWSTESSCRAFGESYKAALAVYTNVLAGMQADLANYASALDAASKSYEQSDANATAALTKLGAVDDPGFQQDGQGRTSYEQSGHHEDLNSQAPTQAADTTPDDKSGATVFPGAAPATATNGSPTTTNAGAPANPTPTNTGDR